MEKREEEGLAIYREFGQGSINAPRPLVRACYEFWGHKEAQYRFCWGLHDQNGLGTMHGRAWKACAHGELDTFDLGLKLGMTSVG